MKLKSKESPREEKTELKPQTLLRVKSNIKAGADTVDLGYCVLAYNDETGLYGIGCEAATCQPN